MIPAEILGSVVPPPGYLYVERLETPARRGLLILPFGASEYTRAHEAIITAMAPDTYASDLQVGQRVLLGPKVTRRIVFGAIDTQERWLATPRDIMATLKQFPEQAITRGDEHALKHFTSEDHERHDPETDDMKFPEGDPQGLR